MGSGARAAQCCESERILPPPMRSRTLPFRQPKVFSTHTPRKPSWDLGQLPFRVPDATASLTRTPNPAIEGTFVRPCFSGESLSSVVDILLVPTVFPASGFAGIQSLSERVTSLRAARSKRSFARVLRSHTRGAGNVQIGIFMIFPRMKCPTCQLSTHNVRGNRSVSGIASKNGGRRGEMHTRSVVLRCVVFSPVAHITA